MTIILPFFIQKSKTDRYKQGSTVYISAIGHVTCPVAVTKRYLEKANIAACSDELYLDLFHIVNLLIRMYLEVINVCRIQELEKFFCLFLSP